MQLRFGVALIVAWAVFCGPSMHTAFAQDPAKPKDPVDAQAAAAQPAAAQPAAAQPAAAQPGDTPPASFEAMFADWKKMLGRLRQIQAAYQIAKADAKPALEKEFNELVSDGNKMAPELAKAAEAAYAADPNKNKDVSGFLASLANSEYKSDKYAEALRIASLLLEKKADIKGAGLDAIAGQSAFVLSDFDTAEKHLKAAEIAKFAGLEEQAAEQAKGELAAIKDYREFWTKEEELRAAEDDLPRVLLKTSKGDITIELFENQAPNTVANFITLVESKFYDGKSFHRVLPGFMAQGGCPKGDGSGGPGYAIPCECEKPDHRKHFQGSLSMAHAGKDTGGSQFFLTFRPTVHLNGKHTVFGRVIEGMDVLAKIQRRDPGDTNAALPDEIAEAKVVRKREHEYKVTKLPEKRAM